MMLRDGKFVLPIGRRLPLRDAAEAQVLAEKGGVGKVIPAGARCPTDTSLSDRTS